MIDLTNARSGDRVIFERTDGRYDIQNVIAPGRLETIRAGLETLNDAREIALGHKNRGAQLWVRHHSSANLIEPYRPTSLDVSNMATSGGTAPSFSKTGEK